MKDNSVVDTLVNVGDYRANQRFDLHFRVYPGSEPAVLLEAGGGADASDWNDLAPILARETGATIITQTDRFRVAVIGAGMTNLVSYAMGHDSPDFLPSHFGGEVWEVKDLLLDRSPIAHANRVTTPTLILHGEHDQRVPIWQGYELYNALNRRGIPTQMVIYPRTGHVPSEPKLLLDVMSRILAWMELYVEGKR